VEQTNLTNAPFAKELASECEKCVQALPRHREINYGSLPLDAFRVARPDVSVQAIVTFPRAADFAEVRYAKMNDLDWTRTRQIRQLATGDGYYFADDERRYDATPTGWQDLCRELLRPLTDKNFKPPKN
jgi:hypothetical protein